MSGSTADLRRDCKAKLLMVVEDLKQQVERDEIHVLAYAAADVEGEHVVTVTANANIKPVTLLGAVAGVMFRLQTCVETNAQPLTDGIDETEKPN